MADTLQQIYNKLKTILSKYSPPLTAKVDKAGRYELYSIKDLVIDGRKRDEVYFAEQSSRSHLLVSISCLCITTPNLLKRSLPSSGNA